MDVKEKLEVIESKIRHLGEAYTRLINDNNRLKVESDVLKKRLSDQENLIKELENKNVHLHIAKTDNTTSEESGTIRKKIDQYISEIDKCIELLNS